MKPFTGHAGFCPRTRVTVRSFVFIVMSITKEKTGEPYRHFGDYYRRVCGTGLLRGVFTRGRASRLADAWEIRCATSRYKS